MSLDVAQKSIAQKEVFQCIISYSLSKENKHFITLKNFESFEKRSKENFMIH